MTLTNRDRKILLALIPLAIVAAYWFLLLAPKREEAARVQDQLTRAQSERDTAMQKLATLGAAKRKFGTDYAAVIALGKSIPSTLDMPSLIVQLDTAARGTGIKFTSIKAGDRTSSSSSPSSSGPGTSGTSGGAAAGSTTPAAQGAGSGSASGSAQTGGDSTLDSVPLDFQFDGSFFDLADFFHKMKRFVRVANHKILVRGRLMTINSFAFTTPTTGFPHLTATVHATVYLAPKSQGVSAGATQSGPAGATPAPAGQTASSSSSTPPAATVTP